MRDPREVLNAEFMNFNALACLYDNNIIYNLRYHPTDTKFGARCCSMLCVDDFQVMKWVCDDENRYLIAQTSEYFDLDPYKIAADYCTKNLCFDFHLSRLHECKIGDMNVFDENYVSSYNTTAITLLYVSDNCKLEKLSELDLVIDSNVTILEFLKRLHIFYVSECATNTFRCDFLYVMGQTRSSLHQHTPTHAAQRQQPLDCHRCHPHHPPLNDNGNEYTGNRWAVVLTAHPWFHSMFQLNDHWDNVDRAIDDRIEDYELNKFEYTHFQEHRTGMCTNGLDYD